MASLIENGQVVSSLCSALLRGGSGLRNIPDLLKRTLRDDMWKERLVERTGEIVRFDSFPAFVKSPMPEGLGATKKLLIGICAEDETAKTMIETAYQGTPGGQIGNQNAAKTNGAQSAIRFEFEDEEEPSKKRDRTKSQETRLRLQQHRSDLLDAVHAGRLTLKAASIQAGFEHPTVPVRLDCAESAARTLRKKATPEFLRELCRLICEGNEEEENEAEQTD